VGAGDCRQRDLHKLSSGDKLDSLVTTTEGTIMADLRDDAISALTESEVKRLETLVEQEVEKEKREELRKKYKEHFRRKLRQQPGGDEAVEDITIDLAKHSDGITIDGVKYLHGNTYTVKACLAQEMRYIMQCTTDHQAEIDGKPRSYYRKRETVISPHGNVNSSQLLKV